MVFLRFKLLIVFVLFLQSCGSIYVQNSDIVNEKQKNNEAVEKIVICKGVFTSKEDADQFASFMCMRNGYKSESSLQENFKTCSVLSPIAMEYNCVK